jgi:hypothetical protein
LMRFLFRYFAHFWLSYFLVSWVLRVRKRGFLKITYVFANIFSQSVACFFILLTSFHFYCMFLYLEWISFR